MSNIFLLLFVIILFGTLSVHVVLLGIFIILIARFLLYYFVHDSMFCTRISFNAVVCVIKYKFWLLKQIITSSWSVTKIIWSPKMNIRPSLKYINISQKTNIGRVIHSHSITLTPGTYTIAIEDKRFLIHELIAFGEYDNLMDRKISLLEDKLYV